MWRTGNLFFSPSVGTDLGRTEAVAAKKKEPVNKKVRTGAEVGRMMIADLVFAYKNALEGTDKGLLSDSEKKALVNALEKKEDVRAYNEFKYLHDFIVTVPMRCLVAQNMAETAFWKLYHLLTTVRRAELENQLIRLEPRVMTQAEFDELRKADFAAKMSVTSNVERLVLHAVEYYAAKYKRSEKTPFDALFNSAEKTPASNPRVMEYNWTPVDGEERPAERLKQKGNGAAAANPFVTAETVSIDQMAAVIRAQREEEQKGAVKPDPDAATLFDILEHAEDFYGSASTGEKTTFFELMADAPDLYEAIWRKLTDIKSLAFIKDVPQKEIVGDGTRISYRQLYDDDVLDYRTSVDDAVADGLSRVAVLQRDGAYIKPENTLFKAFRAEKLTEEYSAHVSECIDTVIKQYKEMYAYHAFLALTGEFCGVDGLEILISPIDENMIDTLNDTFGLWQDISRADGRGPDQRMKLIQSIRALLPPISISSLQPTKKAIHSAREKMSFNIFQGYAAEFINQYLAASEEEKR